MLQISQVLRSLGEGQGRGRSSYLFGQHCIFMYSEIEVNIDRRIIGFRKTLPIG
jgi:hypothetical protein